MSQRTALFQCHIDAGARMVDFAGWEMPIHYGSQIEEHHAVRQHAGMFDVSHMVVLDLEGADVRPYLRHLLANDVSKLTKPGKALYSCMLGESGGVIDDLITYFLSDTFFRVVVNAGTREKDLAWMRQQIEGFELTLTERDDLSMIAVQGPDARSIAASLVDDRDAALALEPFSGAQIGKLFVARTGYTGEDGFEIMVSNQNASGLWQKLIEAGVRPSGLGARDTLRLEAGMNLYGTDMDETVSPLEAGLSWTVALGDITRRFVGRDALERLQSAGVEKKFVGLLLEGRGVLRGHQRVILADGREGEITSGTFSPTLQRSVAMARVPVSIGTHCEVDIRGKRLPVRVVKMPFVRNGNACIDLSV